MCVHAYHGYLDGPREIEVVVTHVIGGCLKGILVQGRRVVHHFIEDRLGCSHCRLVRHQVEVVIGVSLLLYDTGIDAGTRARVEAVLILLDKQSVLNVAIYQAEYNLWFVSLSRVLKHIGYHFNFMTLNLSSHTRSTHTISVDNDLFRELLGLFVKVADGIKYKVLDYFCSLDGNKMLLHFPLRHIWVFGELSLGNMNHFLFVHLGKALCEIEI
jgi:hypothetical protein